MKSKSKIITVFALIIALTCGMFSPLSASAASSIKYDKTYTAYLYAAEDQPISDIQTFHGITIKNATGEPMNVQTSNNKIDVMVTDYDSAKKEATISFRAMKKGKTALSFKMGKKTYTSEIVVKSYTVPAQTIEISGVNGGKNVVSTLSSVNKSSLKLDGKTKNAKLTVQKKGNWRLTEVSVDRSDGQSTATILKKSFNGAAAKKTFKLGTLKTNYEYNFHFTFTNKNNGGVIELEINVS